MPTWSEVEKKYGKRMADRMAKSQYLDCITVTKLPNGEINIPNRDIDLAFRDVNKKYVHPEEWD